MHFKAAGELWNPLSKALLGKFIGSGGQSKRSCLHDRPKFTGLGHGKMSCFSTLHQNIYPCVFSYIVYTLCLSYCIIELLSHIPLLILIYFALFRVTNYMQILGRCSSLHFQIFLYVSWSNELLGTFSWLSLLHKLKSTAKRCPMRPWRKAVLGDIDFITGGINFNTAVALYMATVLSNYGS